MKNLLSLDIAGKMAHFRKFYTNSSSLSYPFPPRTTIIGMLAAILGIERDGYYDLFSRESAKIGVRIMGSSRSIIQTVNYINTKELRHLDGSGGGTQIPLEIILPLDFSNLLVYRIFLTHEDPGVVKEIFSLARERRTKFPLYFGLTEFTAWIQGVCLYEHEDFEFLKSDGEEVGVFTVLPAKNIQEFSELISGIKVHKDRIPLDFTTKRTLSGACSVIWEATGKPLKLKIKGEFFRTPEESGVFLE
ncbi:hypothetical protein H0A61_00623 [Koleobacter methoxysyntrophicus]|jgi:CRISPR-associated protein Cas5h|uniref:CRISPR-associated protein Cas5 n=1 Tax=Koleobacter methoxysyntrophicus TaxID=2751313 RepID=A0A8A0RJB9_9FIRM|nr:CRISPR-associated protein Cas5 [Koleobacter methoxysyntrophicus]NPV43982.1 CRISPR-associated protein Cas5 [Bacillota bacterium]QSQ08303.1 hypothetical protein H0A61_00623 [Koleobacter methoxysyntrophicus]